jgi:dipeptidyl aminopeptidase/acylaminoacyl peptidase
MSPTASATPYGEWSSPIHAEDLANQLPGKDFLHVDQGVVYWMESRPSESGRTTIMRAIPDQAPEEILPDNFSARTRANEYGGKCYTVQQAVLYFVNAEDQQIYRLDLKNPDIPVRITGNDQTLSGNSSNQHFADFIVTRNNRHLISVCEQHKPDEIENSLILICLDEEKTTTIASGADFYSSPRLSPDENHLCWIEWDLPNMPWDGNRLVISTFNADDPNDSRQLPECPELDNKHAAFQPEWIDNESIIFIHDRDGWWNPCTISINDLAFRKLFTTEQEFGLPQWQFGMSTFGIESDNTLVCAHTHNGHWKLSRLYLDKKTIETIDIDCSHIQSIVADGAGSTWFSGSDALSTQSLYTLSLSALPRKLNGKTGSLFPGYMSTPEAISFPTTDDSVAHGFFYPPTNTDYQAPSDSRPPLIVMAHGGPSAAAGTSCNLKIQFWTSRGFAVVDVNYRGSTGFGKKYRQRLNGCWGTKDVEDVAAAVVYLKNRGCIDPGKVIIRGSSAGGFTVLSALVNHNIFGAGACLYGIGNLEDLLEDTHKFESGYLETLVGPWPEKKDIYRQRSPLHKVDQITCPVILLQGLQDKVVPPQQTKQMYETLKRDGKITSYVSYPEEGHGFRSGETIAHSLLAELEFYSKVFGFEPADPTPGINISNYGQD